MRVWHGRVQRGGCGGRGGWRASLQWSVVGKVMRVGMEQGWWGRVWWGEHVGKGVAWEGSAEEGVVGEGVVEDGVLGEGGVEGGVVGSLLPECNQHQNVYGL